MITSSADNKYNGTQKRDELHPLSKTDLKAILCGRENSILQNYTNLFRLDGIRLPITSEAVDLLVDYADSPHLGARGLISSMHKIMYPIRYLAIAENAQTVNISAEDIRKQLFKTH